MFFMPLSPLKFLVKFFTKNLSGVLGVKPLTLNYHPTHYLLRRGRDSVPTNPANFSRKVGSKAFTSFYKKLVGVWEVKPLTLNICHSICSAGVRTLSLPTLPTFYKKFNQKFLNYFSPHFPFKNF